MPYEAYLLQFIRKPTGGYGNLIAEVHVGTFQEEKEAKRVAMHRLAEKQGRGWQWTLIPVG